MKNLWFVGVCAFVFNVQAAMYDVYQGDDTILNTPFDSLKFDKSDQMVSLIKQAEKEYKSGDTKRAEQRLLSAYRLTKGDLKKEMMLIQILGRYYVTQRQAQKLLPLANELVARHPGNLPALSMLAGAQLISNQYSAAEQTLKQIISKNNEDTHHRLMLAGLLAQQKKREKEAQKLIDEVLKLKPNHGGAWALQTKLQIEQQQLQQADESLQQITQLISDQAVVKVLRGDWHRAKLQPEQAIAAYREAYQMKPNNKLLFKIVDLMKMQGQDKGVLQFLKDELDKEPQNLAIPLNLAAIYEQLRDYPQAERYYQIILDQKPDNIIVLNNLALTYYQQNKKEALTLAEKAYQQAKEIPSVADTYGIILLKWGDKKQAMQVLQGANKRAPKSNDIQYHLAMAYAENSQVSQAIKLLQKVLENKGYFPERTDAQALLATLLEKH